MSHSVLQLIIFDLAFWTLCFDGIVVGSVIGSLIALSGTTRCGGYWPSFWRGVGCGLVAVALTYVICLAIVEKSIPPVAKQLVFLVINFFTGLFVGVAGSWYYGIRFGRYRIRNDQPKLQFSLRQLFIWQFIAAVVIGVWLLWHRQELANCRGWW